MPRKSPVALGAIIFGVLAVGLTVFALMRGHGGPPPGPAPVAEKVSQWVAATNIPARTEIARSMLVEEKVSPDKKLPGALTDVTTVQGKLALANINKGDAITDSLLAIPVARVVPANFAIPSGQRAVAIWVDPIRTAAGLVDKGDWIDVVVNHAVTYKDGAGNTGTTISARTIAQDLLVLAVDRSLGAAAAPKAAPVAAGPPPAAGATPAPAAAPTPVSPFIRILVAATPTDAERLIAANSMLSRGRDDVTLSGSYLTVTVRNPNDHLAPIPVHAYNQNTPDPQSLEYPVRMATGPAPAAAGSASTTRAEQSRKDRAAAQLRHEAFQEKMAEIREANRGRVPPMPPNVGPLSGASGPLPPPADEGRSITVIRGTEKTKVLTPAR